MAEFPGRARFVEENSGASPLADRFGVTRYPAIFVGDVLVATPNDFGFYGRTGGEGGRYAPLRSAAAQQRFRDDLERMVTLFLAGRGDLARAAAAPAAAAPTPPLPDLALTDLDGHTLRRADLAGRVVLVDFWATWCPPCRASLPWLGDLAARYGDRLAVITLAVESDPAEVRALHDRLDLPLVWALGPPDLVRAFGDLSAVPTLLLFDPRGRPVATFFGAPPDLHPRVEAALAPLLP